MRITKQQRIEDLQAAVAQKHQRILELEAEIKRLKGNVDLDERKAAVQVVEQLAQIATAASYVVRSLHRNL